MKHYLKKKLIIPFAAVVILLTGTAFKSDFFEIAKQIEIFTTLFKELNMNYVDETNPGDLMNTAIKNMLNDLDPYTRFLNEQDVETARINNTGDYTGIGARVRTVDGKMVVVEPYKGYPADQAGLKAGDELIKIDEFTIADFKDNVSDLLRGEAGSKVNVTYLRQGVTKTATIIREEVEVNAVPLYEMLNDKTGYIALSKFNSKASAETKEALQELKSDGAENIILDLRGNPGGLLHEAINIVNLFVPKNELVVTTKSKVKKYNKIYRTKNEPLDLQIPIVVLIDGGSASASEIVSGALQDLDRAVVIGSRSFGKGLVQRPKKLTYGTQVKITISRYYTPSGRCIQALDYWNRDAQGNAVRTNKADFKEFKTKNGRSVFDGGGVNPDIVVNDSQLSPVTKALIKDNYIFDFATVFYYNNKFATIEDFKFTDSDFQTFKNYLISKEFNFETKTETALLKAIKAAEEEETFTKLLPKYKAVLDDIKNLKINNISAHKKQIIRELEAEIVKRYFYREGLYQHYLVNNEEINIAKEVLANQSKYKNYLK